jgi:hypothetical protein
MGVELVPAAVAAVLPVSSPTSKEEPVRMIILLGNMGS